MTTSRFQPVRVLFLDHVPRMSGAEQSLADLVAGLQTGPIEPVVVLPGDGPLAATLRARGVLVRTVPMSRTLLETSRATLARSPLVAVARLLSFVTASFRVWKIVREVRPRIVHTNTLKSHLLAIIPCAIARVPLVWHLRDILPTGWLRRAFLVCAHRADVIIVPSRAVAEPFRGHRALLRRLRLIPNGIRVTDFQQAASDRSLREMMGVASADPVVGIVGRIAPWKGQDVFLRAAAMVASRHPRAHFAVIGAVLFPENDTPFEQHLFRLATELGIEDRVTFLGWQPAPEAMAAIDVFVHASSEPEPFGRAIVEAMAAGKPVIAAAGGAVQEIVPPAAGFVVPPGRPEMLADAMDRLLSDRKLRARMGEAGAAVAENFFPIERTVQSVAQTYRALVSRAAPRAAHRLLARAPRRPSPGSRRDRARRAASRPQTASRVPPPPPFAPQVPPRFEPQEPPFAPQVSPSFGFEPEAPLVPEFEPPAASPRARATLSPPPPPFPAARASVAIPVLDPAPAEAPAEAPVDAPARVGMPARVHAPAPVRRRAFAPAPSSVPTPIPVPVVAPTPRRLVLPPGVLAPRPVYDAVKRALDVLLAVAILALGLPVWLLIAVAIKLESRGPVMFTGTVYGKDRRPFTYYKFRSMRVDGDDRAHRRFIERYVRENGGHEVDGEVVFKLLGDDRVTSVGRWVRKLSLDEIPQIINILRGQMSFVGPRPPLDYEYDLYDDYAKQRLVVLPGLTGMQQVWSRHMCSFETKLELDLRYVRDRSTWLDLKLIAHTILAIPRGH